MAGTEEPNSSPELILRLRSPSATKYVFGRIECGLPCRMDDDYGEKDRFRVPEGFRPEMAELTTVFAADREPALVLVSPTQNQGGEIQTPGGFQLYNV